MMWIISKHSIFIDRQYTSCGYFINFHFLYIKTFEGALIDLIEFNRLNVELQFQTLQITITEICEVPWTILNLQAKWYFGEIIVSELTYCG